MIIFYFGILSCKFKLLYFLSDNKYILTSQITVMVIYTEKSS